MRHTDPVVAEMKRSFERLRARRAARLADPNTSPLRRRLLEAGPPPAWELEDPMPTPKPTTTRRQRRLDFIKQVKRAMAAGLNVKSASVTADSVVVTFVEAEAPVPADGAVIETENELRKLI